MKRKNKEVGFCHYCGKETTKRVPIIRGRFYCGCQGPVAL